MSRSMAQAGPTLGSPRWAGDFFDRDALIPGGAKLDASQFLSTDAVVVTVDVAGAAANATSIPVIALTGAIPSGTLLDFTGSKKFALLTAAAAAGATSLTVEALPTALVSTDTATYSGVGPKQVPSGTLLGRTLSERDASTGYGPWASGDDEVFLLAFDVTDFTVVADCELYRNGRIVKENFLPGFSSWVAGAKTAVRSKYTCVRGAA